MLSKLHPTLRSALIGTLSLLATASLAQTTIHVGPGQTYTQMITGDFIASRHDVEIKTPGPAEMF